MLNRRELLKLSGTSAFALLPVIIKEPANALPNGPFRFCLNTSTIRGQDLGLLSNVEIAAKAGYDGVELWIEDIRDYLKQGNTIQSLAGFISTQNIVVENGISFTEWLVDDDNKRKKALTQLEDEMKILAALGCRRIAAPPAGVDKNRPVDFQQAGARYHEILALGRKYNVMPLLEFWGASGTLYTFGQALAVAAAANDKDARILPDIFHLFRGGSGFEGLQLVNGKVIEIIHINDYPGSMPAAEQNDSDRVYPGDGIAPIKQILQELLSMGGTKVLSLELFNKTYWAQDAMLVASTGLQKIKSLVNEALKSR
ncbi:MAG: sugar phosphate isomerase/epimerase family protein [Ginsengibacter sp.]